MFSIFATLASAIVGYSAQKSAAKAQQAAGEHSAKLLRIQADNQRDALKTNTRRKHEDRNRYLASVKVAQAANGTVSGTGTNALVFDDITSRLDEQIADFTNASLADIGRTDSAVTSTLWQAKHNAAATRLAAKGTLFKGLVSTATQTYTHFNPPSSTPSAAAKIPGTYSLF